MSDSSEYQGKSLTGFSICHVPCGITKEVGDVEPSQLLLHNPLI